ncbi:hypothetical protein [Larkinella humicola]|uniref:Uncharacterized protein n=1 Tax=Larkinella humicola TaxID=2607654 RepID=A0A5N1JHY7_9BACT|nr:hypothetical protein [Larkinella humicola]KAA9354762.1 hypothetical protein F0P93_09155 [Larkinella humicola]
MEMQLIQGQFSAQDSIQLLTEMVHVKIKYHESKIGSNSSEEDVKMREKRIKTLQKDLFDLRQTIQSSNGPVSIASVLTISLS